VIILAGFLPHDKVENTMVIGELSLDGVVRHARGVLPMAACARANGFKQMFVPEVDAPEARAVLERAKIGINSADNGAWLPDVYHQKMHKPAYFQAVNDMLLQAEANGSVRETLRWLSNAIETGNFP